MWKEFASWYGLEQYLNDHSNIVHYKAPLDLHPVPIVIIKRFKNRKLRCKYHDMKWTADRGHLDRFFWKE